MTALRELFAQFGVRFDTGPLDRGDAAVTRGKRNLNLFGGAARQVSTAIAGMGAALAASLTVGKLVSVVRGTLDEAAALNVWSRRLQMNTRDLDAWNRVGVNYRVTSDQMGAVLNRLRVGAGGAMAGIGEFKAIFEAAHISMQQLRDAQGDTTRIMLLASDAIRNIEDPATKAAIAERLLGGEAATLLPLLEAGREEILGIREAALQNNASIEQLTRSTAGIRREARETNERWRALRIEFVTRLAPALERGARAMGDLVDIFTRAARSSHVLEVSITALGAAAAAAALLTISSWGPVVLPIALAAAAVALLVLAIDDLIVTIEGGDSVLRRIWEWMEGADEAATSIQYLRNELNDLLETFSAVAGFLGLDMDWMGATSQRREGAETGQVYRERLGRIVRGEEQPVGPRRTGRQEARARIREREETWQTARPAGTGARLLTQGALAEQAAIARAPVTNTRTSNVTVNSRPTITINGAMDPQAVGRVVEERLRAHDEEQRREILGATDEVPELLAR